ncbi:hypothetical protein [Brevibacterium metallidurans]|uniref:Uncharacterized protein n=1 Tax=Brevibacterium metallidurans TaxID=1482676 RepID=A0ABN0SRR2_9MICO
MDTSIIVVIAIAVVFVVVVPAMIRRSATELSRVDLDRLPDDAQVVRAESQNPCRDLGERVAVFRAEAVKPSVPSADHAAAGIAPNLRLSAGTPELSVIDGDAQTAEAVPESQPEPESQPAVLPVAVGETRSAFLAGGHDRASGADNVRPLHPAVHAVFAQTGGTGSGRQNEGRAAESVSRLGAGQQRAVRAQAAATANRARRMPPGGGQDRLGGSDPTTEPTSRPDEDPTMTESTAPLRESLRSIGTMVRGFALTFLASVLGVIVTSVLAFFSVVHPALIGVFAGLAVVSLFIVRTLNMRKREIRKRLRRMTGAVTEVEDDADAEAATTSRAAVTAGSTATGAAKTAGSTRSSTVGSTAARAQAMAAAKAAATPRSTASETKASSADEKATTAKTARERALQQRSATAKYAREEAVTGEIPVVRIRNESAEGHTTRQILLTGPIPVIAEPAAVTNAAEKADTTPAETSSPVAAADEASEVVAASTTSVAADLADTVVQSAQRSAAAKSAAEAAVNDPFQQRLKARDGWSPTPLPVPSYVGAQEAEHAVPTPKAADASSYETQARSREDIAAQFAEELGYRAELSDSAREDSPLEHGRKAIRADRAPALDAVNDVLARRRA